MEKFELGEAKLADGHTVKKSLIKVGVRGREAKEKCKSIIFGTKILLKKTNTQWQLSEKK